MKHQEWRQIMNEWMNEYEYPFIHHQRGKPVEDPLELSAKSNTAFCPKNRIQPEIMHKI